MPPHPVTRCHRKYLHELLPNKLFSYQIILDRISNSCRKSIASSNLWFIFAQTIDFLSIKAELFDRSNFYSFSNLIKNTIRDGGSAISCLHCWHCWHGLQCWHGWHCWHCWHYFHCLKVLSSLCLLFYVNHLQNHQRTDQWQLFKLKFCNDL